MNRLFFFFFGKCGRGFYGSYRAILGGINNVRHGLSLREWYALRCLLYWNYIFERQNVRTK